MKLHDCYLLTDHEMFAIMGSALLDRLLKHKLVLVCDRMDLANITEQLTEKINTTWYYKEDEKIKTSNNEVYIRLYFDGQEAKDQATDCINAEISSQGLTR